MGCRITGITLLLLLTTISIVYGEVTPISGVLNVGFDLDIDEPYEAGFDQKPFALSQRAGSKGLLDFTPISNIISQSEIQYYSFNVNTSTGVGEYYEFLIFLTGNLCSQPDNLDNDDPSLTVYYSFNATMFQNNEIGQMGHFKNGYFQALADVPSSDNGNYDNTILYIAVRAPENTNKTQTWSYQLGVSQNDLVFQWDDRSWASVVDTDDRSALIVTGNLTGTTGTNYSDWNATKSNYALYLYSYDYKDYFDKLNSSWCAVRNGPALFSTTSFETKYTQRNGALQQQFYVPGLNASTKYVAYLVSDFKGTNFGGAVYQPFEFETQEADVCRLIFDLEFCSQVAYSVPTNSELSQDELKEKYDAEARALYLNFSKALQQIACDTTSDAIFSPIRTCDDCAALYKDWLCAVTIPRCSTSNHTGYKHREVGESRNDFINDEIAPQMDYYEVLPCVNVCQAIVRDCPADFGFMCPTRNVTIKESYYWDDSSDYVACNFVGVPIIQTSTAVKLLLNWLLVLLITMLATCV